MKVILTLCVFCLATVSTFAQVDFTNDKTMRRMKASLGLSEDQANHILRLEVGYKAKVEEIMANYPEGEERNTILKEQLKHRDTYISEIMTEQQYMAYKDIDMDREGYEQYRELKKSKGKEVNVLGKNDGITQ